MTDMTPSVSDRLLKIKITVNEIEQKIKEQKNAAKFNMPQRINTNFN
jgi:hypothetical protein